MPRPLPERDPIQSLWLGRRLSNLERLTALSFLQNGHPFHLYVYNEIEGVPDGVELKDANQIVPHTEIFSHTSGFAVGSYAGFADYFRYMLLYKRGNWWADLDEVCVKPFDFEAAHVFCSYFEQQIRGDHAGNSVMKAPAGSSVMAALIEACHERYAERDNYGAWGVRLVKSVLDRNGWEDYTVPRVVFCPINFTEARRFISGPDYFHYPRRFKRWVQKLEPVGAITRNTHAIHLFHGTWMANNWNPDDTFHPKSVFEQLKLRYLVAS